MTDAAINVRDVQTRTSPFGFYATHEPCGRVLTAEYATTDREAYRQAIAALRDGHRCGEVACGRVDGAVVCEATCWRSTLGHEPCGGAS